ncbi:MAG TPA: cobalamin-dependent protein [Patescibacteria group bacterium]|nr:cobalamin-dependent protein [Patescibacteria group bacterium]
MAKVDLVKAVTELEEDLVTTGVKEQMAEGITALDILSQLQQGMEQVGKLYESGEYFLSELIMSAEVFTNAANLLGEELSAGGGSEPVGTMVLGTVKDDIHDIGKNIVSTIMSCNGFKVIDLGVDVPIATFVEAVKVNKPQIVGMCCLLTTAFEIMKETVAAVRAAGGTAKILVGGGPVDDNVAKYVGADGCCKSAYEAVETARKIVGVN